MIITLDIGSVKTKISSTDSQFLKRLVEQVRINIPGAYFGGFHAKKHYYPINKDGMFMTGYVVTLIDFLKEEYGNEIKQLVINDSRPKSTLLPPKRQIGDFKLFDHNYDALVKLYEYNPYNLNQKRGILAMATNAGKTALSASIHLMGGNKTIFLVNSKDLFIQMLKEIPEIIGDNSMGYIKSGKNGIKWADFMVCMVKTTQSLIRTGDIDFISKYTGYKTLIVDECDLATNNQFFECMDIMKVGLIVGLSGSALKGKTQKYKIKNSILTENFGQEIAEISNLQLESLGISSSIKCVLFKNDKPTLKKSMSDIMEKIIENQGLPCLVFLEFQGEVEELYKVLYKKYRKEYKIDWVHGGRVDRQPIIQDFQDGKIDILVSSKILLRAKNFKLLRSILNGMDTDRIEKLLQMLGRARRKHESKEFVYIFDFIPDKNNIKSYAKFKRRLSLYKKESTHQINYL